MAVAPTAVAPAVAVRLLGPPELVVDGTPVGLPLGHRAAVLALLALHHPTGVGQPVLADGLWGPGPPSRAANAVQGHVSRLRGLGLAIERTGPQYRLTGDVRVDAAELAGLVAAGDADLRAERPAEAAQRLRAALALFRGPVLAGLEELPFAAVEIARLEGARAAAHRARIEADLRLGRYSAVLPELEALLDDRPDDEGLLAMLMRALHGAGRHGDALAAYDRGRRRLVADHGITPSPELRALHRAMLDQTHREAPAPQRAPAVPRQVPHGPAVFVGREAEVRELVELLAPAGTGGPAPIAAVDGPGGVGKTALAIHVADLLAPAFGDGVLFAALGGGDPGRAPAPETVLGRFLTALGVPAADVPADAEAAAARFRTEVAGRRVLVVLDDAADAERVRPLLPVGGGCAALVTSRAPLALAEAVPVGLGMLGLAEAGDLLRKVGRISGGAADEAAVVAVARACGRLPLALHIAGGRMANRPPAFAARLAELLADETRRLGELRLGNHDVRSSFAVSHRLLSPDEQRAFGLLARWAGPTVPTDVAAALLDAPAPDVEAVLNRLVTVRLLDEVEPGRYRFHDLLRLFGRERAGNDGAADDEGPQQAAALGRALRHLLDSAVTADAALAPGPAPAPGEPDRRDRDRAAALAWFEAELANLVAAAGLAADLPDPAAAPIAWALGDAAFRYLDFTKRWAEWAQVCEHGVRAARRVGDAHGEATSLNRLGCAYRERGQVAEARDCLERALDLARARADVPFEMSVLNNLANTLQDAGLIDEAVAVHGRKLDLARRTGDRYNLAVALNNLGDIHLQDDDLDAARRMFTESRDLLAELGDLRALGMALHNLAEVALRQGRADESARLYRTGAERSREAGDSYSRAASLVGLGHALRAAGDEPAARAAWREAHPILAGIDPAEAEEVAALAAEPPGTAGEQGIQH